MLTNKTIYVIIYLCRVNIPCANKNLKTGGKKMTRAVTIYSSNLSMRKNIFAIGNGSWQRRSGGETRREWVDEAAKKVYKSSTDLVLVLSRGKYPPAFLLCINIYIFCYIIILLIFYGCKIFTVFCVWQIRFFGIQYSVNLLTEKGRNLVYE